MAKRGLGKGLCALIPLVDDIEQASGIIELDMDNILPNQNQPRSDFDQEELAKLANSIQQHGIIQPIVVRPIDNIYYQIVAGERRWRAAKELGFKKIPAIQKELSDSNAMEVAITENVQRVDLNPIEEATAYEKLLQKYHLSQEQLATRIGKNRSTIANLLRLLSLPDKVKEYIKSGELSSGHGRALASVDNPELQERIAHQVVSRGLSVRDVETLVKSYLAKDNTKTSKPVHKSEDILYLEDNLRTLFGTKVELLTGEKKGKIMIEYYSNDELERILELFYSIQKNGQKCKISN